MATTWTSKSYLKKAKKTKRFMININSLCLTCLICWNSILFIAPTVRGEAIYSSDKPVLQVYLWSGFILIQEVR